MSDLEVMELRLHDLYELRALCEARCDVDSVIYYDDLITRRISLIGSELTA